MAFTSGAFANWKKRSEATWQARRTHPRILEFRCVKNKSDVPYTWLQTAFMNSQARYQHSRNYLAMYCETNSPWTRSHCPEPFRRQGSRGSLARLTSPPHQIQRPCVTTRLVSFLLGLRHGVWVWPAATGGSSSRSAFLFSSSSKPIMPSGMPSLALEIRACLVHATLFHSIRESFMHEVVNEV